jgi:predicted amidohydrolase YtcJ
MRNLLATISALTVSALALAACNNTPASPPDAIYHNATIYTGVDGQLPATAVSVKDGRIVEVGAAEELLKSAGATTETIDLGGAFLYPGFTDAHAHLYGIGEREQTLDLDEVKSIAELVGIVGEAAKALPAGQPLVGRGWIETHWPEKRFPTRQDIDAVAGDRPVVLVRADSHAMVVNTAALKAVGLDGKPASQPSGGRIEVDAQGLPTGMLIDNAMAAIGALEASPAEAQIRETYAKGIAREVTLGWTGLHNMSVAGAHIATLNAMDAAGEMKLRLYNAVDGGDFTLMTEGGLWGASRDGLVTTKAIKLYMDGALGSCGALLSAPYSDQPETTGLLRSNETETLALLKKAYEANIQVCFHAIGDEGNKLVLDWMGKTFADGAAADATVSGADRRWRIEHSQILHVEDIPRFNALGIIPSMQPSHAIGDLYFAPARLGPDRLAGAYAWRALIDAGSIIAGGSDAPVEQGDPRIEFYAAVARKDLKGASGADWHPEQAVSREEALKMFTLWPAIASFREDDLGTIEAGKLADFTGFSGDIMKLPEAEILTVTPAVTVVSGKIVYRAQ